MMVVNMVPPRVAFAAETEDTVPNVETVQPVEPDTPAEEPDTPSTEPDTSTESDTSTEEPGTPSTEPDAPTEKPDTPPTEPDTSTEEPGTPLTEPDAPTEELGTPSTEPDKPAEDANNKTSPAQALINALPDADSITEDNAEDVQTQLAAIDEARAELTDEELDTLDTTRYEAVISALMTLAGMAGAEQPQTLEGETPTTTGVATVNGTSYATIDDAFANATSGTATIELLQNTSTSSTLTVPSGADITLNIPAGMTLTSTETGYYAIEVQNGGKLTVTGGGTITTASADYCVKVNTGATFTVPEAATVTFASTDSTQGIGLYASKDATVTLSGGTFTGGKYAIRVDNSIVLGFILEPGYSLQNSDNKWLANLNNTTVDGTATVTKGPVTATLADQILEEYCQTVKLEVTVTPAEAVGSYAWYKKGQLSYLDITNEPSCNLSVADHNNSSVYCIIDGSDGAGNWQVFSNTATIEVPACTHADVDPDTGKCAACDIQMAASVTCAEETTYYADFSEAFATANGKTADIKVLGTITLEEGLTVSTGSITLDMNDQSLSIAAGPAFTAAGGTLALKNANISCETGTCVQVTGGHLDVYSGTIRGATAISTPAANTKLYGGTFTGTTNAIEVTSGGNVGALLPTGLGYTLGYQDANGKLIEDTTVSALAGEVTIVAAEQVVESVAISNENNVLTAEVTFKQGVPTNTPVTYQWYWKVEGDTAFQLLEGECESTLSLDGLPEGAYQFRCDVTAFGKTTASEPTTVTVTAPATTFDALRVNSEGGAAPATYEFGDTINIMAAVQAAGYPSEYIPASIEVCEGGNSLISVQSMFIPQSEGTYFSRLMLPAAMFETGETEHTLTLKFTDLYGALAAAEAELEPFMVNPSQCGDNPHVVVDETIGICSKCGVHCDAKVGDNAYLTLDEAVAAAVGNSTPKDVTITLLPPLNPSPLNRRVSK